MFPRTILINPTNLKTHQEEELLYALCKQGLSLIEADTPYSVKHSGATVQVKLSHRLAARNDLLGELEYIICKEMLVNQAGFRQYSSLGKLILDEDADTATYSSRTFNSIVSDIDFNPTENNDRNKATYLQNAMMEALQHDLSKNYYIAGENHFSYIDSKTYIMHHVTLNSSHPLVIRPRENYLGEFRLDAISTQLGKGSFGLVHQIMTMIIDPATPLALKREDRVIKLSNDKLADAQNEHEKSARILGRGSKTPNVHTHQGKTFFSREEHLMPGIDLSKLLADCRANPTLLSTDQRLWLMKQGLEQLIEVHHAKIVHRDVKPENIRIDLAHLPRPKWQYIDFGLAKWARDIDRGVGLGTAAFISPEMYDGKGTTAASDSYALGIILGLLFGANENQFLLDKTLTKTDAVKKIAEFSHHYQFTNLFSYPHDLSDAHKAKLEDVIKRLVLARVENRIQLLAVHDVICGVLMEREIAANPDKATLITNCFTLLKKLTEYVAPIGAQSIDTNMKYFKIIQEKLIEFLRLYLKDDAHVQYYVSIQSSSAFEKCKTVDEVTEICQKMFSEFTETQRLYNEFAVNLARYSQGLAKRDDVDIGYKKMARELLLLVSKLMAFPQERNFSLDNVIYFTRKAQKRLPTYKEQFDYLKREVTDSLAQSSAVVSSNPASQFHAGSSGRTETSEKSTVTPTKKI